MSRKPIIGLVIIGVVALVTYTVVGAIGSQIVGSREEWSVWRESHLIVFVAIWLGSVVVISLPTLWFAGRRLDKTLSEHEQSVAAAAGVGRFAVKALQGDISATDKLFDLLEDQSLPVRCQAARGLALLDRREVDKELFRQVRYWLANDKLVLVSTLRNTRDFRTRRLMEILVNDRNPIVQRRARAAMAYVTPRTSRVDKVAASVKEAQTAAGESVGLGERSAGQRRSVGVRPKAAPSTKAESEGATGLSMAPADRAARAAARSGAKDKRRAAKAAAKADDQPPMRAAPAKPKRPAGQRPAEPDAAKPKRPPGERSAAPKRPSEGSVTEPGAPAKPKRPAGQRSTTAGSGRPAGEIARRPASPARAATKPSAAPPAVEPGPAGAGDDDSDA